MTEGTRNKVLRGAAGQFTQKARELAGVAEIAICGSVAGNDPDPYDLDIAVVMTALDSLEPFAKYARQMSSVSHAWEVFLFDDRLVYQGRICQRRECPGGSVECMGPNCGKIPHVKIIRDFQFDEKQFFESPFEILHQTTDKSRLLSYREHIGITSSRTYTPLKPMKVDCIECGRRFTIDAGEQKWYTRGGLTLPKRCDRCRSKKYF